MKHPRLVKFLSTSLWFLDAIFLAYIYAISPLWIYIVCVILYLLFGKSLDNYFNVFIFIVAIVRDLFVVQVNSYLPLLMLSIGILYQIVVYKIFKYELFMLSTAASEFERSLQKNGKKPTFHQTKRSLSHLEEIHAHKNINYTDNKYNFPEDDYDETNSFTDTVGNSNIDNDSSEVNMCREIVKNCELSLPKEHKSSEIAITSQINNYLLENDDQLSEEYDAYALVAKVCIELLSSGIFHKAVGELDENSEAPALCFVFDHCMDWLKENNYLSEEDYNDICAELQENISSAG